MGRVLENDMREMGDEKKDRLRDKCVQRHTDSGFLSSVWI